MGLFNLFKKKKNPLEEMMEKINNSIFPKGPKDIEAGTEEFQNILGYKIDLPSFTKIVVSNIFLHY